MSSFNSNASELLICAIGVENLLSDQSVYIGQSSCLTYYLSIYCELEYYIGRPDSPPVAVLKNVQVALFSL